MAQEIDGLVQGRRNSSALAMELSLSCINPPWFNIKLHLTSIGNAILEIKLSYLQNGISYTGKTSLYWIMALILLKAF